MCSICCFVVRPPHCTRIISAPPSAPTDLLSHVLALVHRRLSGVTRLPPSHAPGRRRCRRAAIALRTGPGGPGGTQASPIHECSPAATRTACPLRACFTASSSSAKCSGTRTSGPAGAGGRRSRARIASRMSHSPSAQLVPGGLKCQVLLARVMATWA